MIKYDNFEDVRINQTFMFGCTLYVKTSKHQALAVFPCGYDGELHKRKFLPGDKCERLKTVKMRGKDRSKNELEW